MFKLFLMGVHFEYSNYLFLLLLYHTYYHYYRYYLKSSPHQKGNKLLN